MSEYEALVAVVSVVFGCGAGIGITWLIARTVLAMRRAPEIDTSSMQRLEARMERIEQAIDAVAVEVERVSEGQRFTTRLLSDQAGSKAGVSSGP